MKKVTALFSPEEAEALFDATARKYMGHVGFGVSFVRGMPSSSISKVQSRGDACGRSHPVGSEGARARKKILFEAVSNYISPLPAVVVLLYERG